jgi:uncharacterized protein (TIGR03435 family)
MASSITKSTAARRGLILSPASELEGQQKMFKSEVFETTSAPSIFTVVQELGLRLERRKAPIPHFVIDHVEKIPSEN